MSGDNLKVSKSEKKYNIARKSSFKIKFLKGDFEREFVTGDGTKT